MTSVCLLQITDSFAADYYVVCFKYLFVTFMAFRTVAISVVVRDGAFQMLI